ncbi:MAG TPA: Rrf2 family transcriptional regulator [Acetobacteraceae bacterium]|jgi:Rrf2 family transcriptional regulator, nitric oxide-sensitive transcriptional repressor|nr:Rrf2 family transcriptional regulator [Acetobacteraceae bacterium]
MRLTAFTEYSLRVLVYLARYPDRFVTIKDIAAAEGISANHLMKVAQHLGAAGDVLTLRGPRGGLRLGRPAEAIRVGDVVRRTEPNMGPADDHVVGRMIGEAQAAFMAVLDGLSVADLAVQPRAMTR